MLLLAIVFCAGCATPTPAPLSHQAAEATCRNVMYQERMARGRGAVNWNLYDYCLRRYAG